ncbi:MAG: carbamoyl phosphate synthase small subunit [Deltaproteobacteria bacterium]|nr:carbamoyl phosphate synthase small subunit [Deltaproteobacteria bacterium]
MKAIHILLEDNSQWPGYSFGADISTSGELVFNTGMVGYPESLTDPSYRGQILMCTYPLIGNYGVPNQEISKWGFSRNFESTQIQASGFIVSHYCEQWSHWKGEKSLGDWLKEENIPGVTGVDTRSLTRHLRAAGTMLAKIIVNETPEWYQPQDHHLVAQVSCTEPHIYGSGSKTVALIDCGAKNNIIHQLLQRDCTVHVVPWDFPVHQHDFDGIFVSNGPGDPRHCAQTIQHLSICLQRNKPIFGICMGHQLLGMAAGASVFKLKYGHRSQNQPVIEVGSNRALITSQNHGYALDHHTLPEGWSCWYENLNDKTCAGIIHRSQRFCGVQFHPEASPGPTDSSHLFSRFRELVEQCS